MVLYGDELCGRQTPINQSNNFQIALANSASDSSSNTPLTSLPLGIRNRIYDEFLAPFRDRKSGQIDISVCQHGYGMRHPMRSCVAVYISCKPNKSHGWVQNNGEIIDYQKYEWLRQLANSNRQVRAELGKLFWQNISLNTRGFHFSLPNLLLERPWIGSGIKKLRMEWRAEGSGFASQRQMADLIEYVGKRLVLDELRFVLEMSGHTARQLLSMPEDQLPKWVKACREFRAFRIEKDGLHVDFVPYGEAENWARLESLGTGEQEEEAEHAARLGDPDPDTNDGGDGDDEDPEDSEEAQDIEDFWRAVMGKGWGWRRSCSSLEAKLERLLRPSQRDP